MQYNVHASIYEGAPAIELLSFLYNIPNWKRTSGRVVPVTIPRDHHLVPSLLDPYTIDIFTACVFINPDCPFVIPDIDNNCDGSRWRFRSLPFFWSYPSNRVAITTTCLNSISIKCKYRLGISDLILALRHEVFICEVLGPDLFDPCDHNRGFQGGCHVGACS